MRCAAHLPALTLLVAAPLDRIHLHLGQFCPPGLFAGLSGLPNPGNYPLYVQSTYPTAKEAKFSQPNFFEAVDKAVRVAQRRSWGLPDGAFVIGIVARLSPVKNHVLLLKAMAQLDGQFHLVVIGDGPSRAGLEQLARQLGIGSRAHFVVESGSS